MGTRDFFEFIGIVAVFFFETCFGGIIIATICENHEDWAIYSYVLSIITFGLFAALSIRYGYFEL